jgi:hypothetical protein
MTVGMAEDRWGQGLGNDGSWGGFLDTTFFDCALLLDAANLAYPKALNNRTHTPCGLYLLAGSCLRVLILSPNGRECDIGSEAAVSVLKFCEYE